MHLLAIQKLAGEGASTLASLFRHRCYVSLLYQPTDFLRDLDA